MTIYKIELVKKVISPTDMIFDAENNFSGETILFLSHCSFFPSSGKIKVLAARKKLQEKNCIFTISVKIFLASENISASVFAFFKLRTVKKKNLFRVRSNFSEYIISSPVYHIHHTKNDFAHITIFRQFLFAYSF